MNCPTCSSRLTPVEGAAYFTDVAPDYTFSCGTCDRTLLVFTIWGEGSEDMNLWQDEVPLSGFTEFVHERMRVHRIAHPSWLERMPCECSGSLEILENTPHFDDLRHDFVIRCRNCRQTFVVVVGSDHDGDLILKSENNPPGGAYRDFVDRRLREKGL